MLQANGPTWKSDKRVYTGMAYEITRLDHGGMHADFNVEKEALPVSKGEGGDGTSVSERLSDIVLVVL